MSEIDYRLIAAGFYLCDSEECSMEHQLEQLDKADINGTTYDVPDLLVWEPLEGYSIGTLIDNIDCLANNFEEIYKRGEFDGYEKIKNLIDKQYETKP